MKRITSTALALVFASSAPGLAATYTFSDIDADRNLELTSTEFSPVAQDTYSRWDVNSDQRIEENEFYSGLYHDWDLDNDDVLTETEYNEGWSNWFGDGDPVAYSTLDADANAGLTTDEFGTGFADAGLYDRWDTAGDGFLDQNEFATGLYDVYDADNNKLLTQAEYGAFGGGLTTAGVGGADNTLRAEIVSLSEWRYDDLYRGGESAEDFIDEMEVYGLTGEEIGDVEDVIVGQDGRILSVVAEVGGIWDIGDTHVSIPWDRVQMNAAGDGIVVPVSEETVGDYSLFSPGLITAATAATDVVAEVDDVATGPRAWRVSELIGDYARLREGDGYANYGYINDVILKEGRVAAVVVSPDFGYGARGRFAYPYYGYGYGWNPGTPFYDLPYSRDDVTRMEPFDYERFAAE